MFWGVCVSYSKLPTPFISHLQIGYLLIFVGFFKVILVINILSDVQLAMLSPLCRLAHSDAFGLCCAEAF